MTVSPVRLPPGRARLATIPVTTGSAIAAKTIGIVFVAFFAIVALAAVMIMSNLELTNSAANSRRRSSFLQQAVFDNNVFPFCIA
jgi:hypothetical protein